MNLHPLHYMLLFLIKYISLLHTDTEYSFSGSFVSCYLGGLLYTCSLLYVIGSAIINVEGCQRFILSHLVSGEELSHWQSYSNF